MRIAIFHNYMDNIGGAEFVTLTMARELNADVYTTVVNRDMVKKMGFDVPVQTIGNIPVNAPMRQQLAAHRFKKLRLQKKYDFYIIGGDWAASAAKNHKPNLWIVYSPPRELWDLYTYVRENNIAWWARWIFDLWVSYNRRLTKKNLPHITNAVAISNVVQKRVKNFLGLGTEVLHPPTETSNFYYEKNGDYWLSVNRLIGHKRIDMQIEAFKKMPDKKLIIVGSYEQSQHFLQYVDYIRKILPKNVEIKSWVEADELRKLYANCKSFLTTSMDEDYGMNVVEAMASGKPVIAPNEGGYQETIIHGTTGILIDQISPDKIVNAVNELEKNPSAYKDACIARAKEFDTKRFIAKIKAIVEKSATKKNFD